MSKVFLVSVLALGLVGSVSPLLEELVSSNVGRAHSVDVVDIDRNGYKDILAAGHDSRKFYVFLNDGNSFTPGFTECILLEVDGPARGIHSYVETGLTTRTSWEVAVAYGDSVLFIEADIFSGPGPSPTPAPTRECISTRAIEVTSSAAGAHSVFIGAIDDRAGYDIVVGSAYDNSVRWFQRTQWLLFQPSEFGAGRLITDQADYVRSVHIADMNNDGINDILVASQNDDSVRVFWNQGGSWNPTFTEQLITNSADGASWVYAADLNKDGCLDMLVTSTVDDSLRLFLNDCNSNASFAENLITSDANQPESVHAADFDGDGTVDIVLASNLDNTVRVFLNDGSSTPKFTEHVAASDVDGAFSVVAADFNGDDLVDILVASKNDNSVRLFLNEFDFVPTVVPTPIPTTPAPTKRPTSHPTHQPTSSMPTMAPSADPTNQPTSPDPTMAPSANPTNQPTSSIPTMAPSADPTNQPTSPVPTIAPTADPTSPPSASPAPSGLPYPNPTWSPTHRPSPAPTGMFGKLENVHYLAIATSTLAVLLLTIVIRLDMPEYQKARVGFLNSFVVAFAWLDFIGDVTWIHQRFYASDIRGDEGHGRVFGVCSLVALVVSVLVTAYMVMSRVVLKHRDLLRRDKLNSYALIAVIVMSWTDPESIIFFPWTREAYTNDIEQSLPNEDMVRVTLVRLLEDVPQFIIQVCFIAVGAGDGFTIVNLTLTVLMICFMLVGKFLVISLGSDDDQGRRRMDSSGTSGARGVELPSSGTVPRNFHDVVTDLKHRLREEYGVQTHMISGGHKEARRLDEILADAHTTMIEVPNWEKLSSPREKVFAMAEELQIPIATGAGGAANAQHETWGGLNGAGVAAEHSQV